jgi:hypothetical protein
MLPIDVTIIVVSYLTLIRLIVVSIFGLLDLIYPEWDPELDAQEKSLRRIQRRRIKHNPFDHRWNHRHKRYNRQWARTRVYPFRIRRFKSRPPGVFPQDQDQDKNQSQMPFLLSVFCIAAGTERTLSDDHVAFRTRLPFLFPTLPPYTDVPCLREHS